MLPTEEFFVIQQKKILGKLTCCLRLQTTGLNNGRVFFVGEQDLTEKNHTDLLNKL